MWPFMKKSTLLPLKWIIQINTYHRDRHHLAHPPNGTLLAADTDLTQQQLWATEAIFCSRTCPVWFMACQALPCEVQGWSRKRLLLSAALPAHSHVQCGSYSFPHAGAATEVTQVQAPGEREPRPPRHGSAAAHEPHSQLKELHLGTANPLELCPHQTGYLAAEVHWGQECQVLLRSSSSSTEVLMACSALQPSSHRCKAQPNCPGYAFPWAKKAALLTTLENKYRKLKPVFQNFFLKWLHQLLFQRHRLHSNKMANTSLGSTTTMWFQNRLQLNVSISFTICLQIYTLDSFL